MDDTQQHQHRPYARRGGIMDIQPRRPQQYANGDAASAESTQPVLDHEPVPSNVETPKPAIPDTVQTQPSPTETAELQAEPPAPATSPKPGLSPELLAQAESEAKQQEQAKQALLAARKSHKNRGPIIASIFAIVIAFSLAGLTVYVYISQNRTDSSKQSAQEAGADNQANSSETPQPATAAEVEDLAKELDATINATDESQEIPEEALNEGSVGL